MTRQSKSLSTYDQKIRSLSEKRQRKRTNKEDNRSPVNEFSAFYVISFSFITGLLAAALGVHITDKETDESWDICIYNMKNQFWAGLGSRVVLVKKKFGPIMSNF